MGYFRHMPMRPGWALPLIVASLGPVGLGCEGEDEACPPLAVDSDTACDTSEDCVAAGFTSLRCVNRRCALPCSSDADCALSPSPECAAEQGLAPSAVCEAELCRLACPGVPCPDGQSCHLGRCLLAVEDFELRPGDPVVSFERLGWNGVPTELANPRRRLVARGRPGCAAGGAECAGPAASGERFAVLGTQPTSEKGTAVLGSTCRPCACCLECTIEPSRSGPGGSSLPYDASPSVLEECPYRRQVPAPLMCPASVPAACSEVCAACERCPASGQSSDPSLVACEAVAAARTCPACPMCDLAQCGRCRDDACRTECAADRDLAACRSCEAAACPPCAACRACDACGEAVACERVDPNAAACRAKRLECDALGVDGCYPTPIAYQRSELTDLEQSLVSPELDLSRVGGPVVLSFAYVPFRVGETYFESRQGVPASEWQRRPQEVVVELCAGGCEREEAWVAATLLRGGLASFPPSSRRDNGVSLGRQSEVDWRSGRVEVRVPAELATGTFRFRFLPRLGAEAEVGIDDIRLRPL